MADPRTFSPRELDRIEDALERLDDPTWDLDDALAEDAPEIRSRLQDYREILLASREALPLEEPPADVLAGVIAQARESLDVQALGVAEAPSEVPSSWWQRFRRTLLVPGVAVAATAVLVLIIVQPTAKMADSATAPASAEIDAKLATAETTQSVPAATPVSEAEKSEAEAEEEAPLREIATSRRPGAGAGEAPATPSAAAPVSGAAADPGASPAEDSAEQRADKNQATPRWDLIARGDRARRDGDCTRARDEYMAALDDDDLRVRARAEAGIGLCDMVDGAYTKAQERYDRARELDPQVVGFIEDERPQGSLGGAGKASRAKRSSKPKASKKAQQAAPPPNAFEDQALE